MAKEISDTALERKVFKYDSSERDKRMFRVAIMGFVKGETLGKSFTEFMFHHVWLRNGCGVTGKYTYFNEHIQRVFLDRDFFKWCTRTITKIEDELKKIPI